MQERKPEQREESGQQELPESPYPTALEHAILIAMERAVARKRPPRPADDEREVA